MCYSLVHFVDIAHRTTAVLCHGHKNMISKVVQMVRRVDFMIFIVIFWMKLRKLSD